MRSWLVVVILLSACDRDGESASASESNEACEATYAKLEELGCKASLTSLLARGCFEIELAPDDCDMRVLDPCAAELSSFAKQPGGWWEPLQSFLDRSCGPEGSTSIEWPKPDTAALAAAKAAAAAAEAAAAEAEAAAADAEREAAAKAFEAALAVARVEVGTPTVQGALSKTSIRKVVVASERLETVRECYAAGLARGPELAGDVTINFVVTGTGKVGSAVVQASTVRDSSVGNCIAKAIKQMPFPAPRGGGNVIATLPYALSSRH